MKKIFFTSILAIAFLSTIVSCGNDHERTDNQSDKDSAVYTPSEQEIAYDEYIAGIESNDSLMSGKSLYYSKGDGSSTEVEFFLNDKNEMVKLIEYYTQETMSIAKNIFYFMDNHKIASRELFEQGKGDDLVFVERLTYYNDDERPIITKKKEAMYEEELDFESYEIIPKHDCSMQRALNILDQQGEFATTFKGFIKEDVFTYLIVGGSGNDSYASSLIVQQTSPTIIKLQQDEAKMLGMPLIVDFEIVQDPGEGFEYQILRSVNLR